MRSARLVAAAAAGLGLLAAPGAAVAQALEVTPIQVELTSAARSDIVTLHNRGTAPVRYQVSVLAWQQGPRGEMRLSRTKDVTFFPSLLTVGPGEKRNLRVAAAAPFGAVEKTYRLFVEQLPGAPDPDQKGVRVLTRVGIPVYLEPPEPVARAEVSELRVDGRRVSFTVRNTGNVRVRPASVRLVASDGQGGVVFERALSAWYVLAGGERIFEAEAPRDRCTHVRALTATVSLESGAIEKRLEVPGGACAP